MRNETLAVMLLLGCSIMSCARTLGGAESRRAERAIEAQLQDPAADRREPTPLAASRPHVELLAEARSR